MHTHITVKGARVNNLKNIDVKIPRDKLVTVPTVDRGFLEVVFWSMEMAGDRPSM